MDRIPRPKSNTEKRKEYLDVLKKELQEASVVQTGKAYGDGKGGIVVHQPQSFESLREWAMSGNLAVMINIKKREIYIGDDHRGMWESQAIPEDDALVGITRFDREKNVIEMDYLGDSRASSRAIFDHGDINEEGPRTIVAGKIQQFLFPKQTP